MGRGNYKKKQNFSTEELQIEAIPEENIPIESIEVTAEPEITTQIVELANLEPTLESEAVITPFIQEKNELEINPIVKEEEKQTFNYLYMVQVTYPRLNRRADHNENAEIKGVISDQGYYKIYNEVDGWGQLKDKSWIKLAFTKRV